MEISFENLSTCDLSVGDILKSTAPFGIGQDPISSALPRTRNMAGFRSSGPAHVVLTTNFSDPLWPDSFDRLLGKFIYFGDNRTPGEDIHDTPQGGNRCLRKLFDSLAAGRRNEIPPIFIFGPGNGSRGFRFYGLFAPGPEDLTAVLKSDGEARFLNYRATFTLLDCPVVPRDWIKDVVAQSSSVTPPNAWREFVVNGVYRHVTATLPP